MIEDHGGMLDRLEPRELRRSRVLSTSFAFSIRRGRASMEQLFHRLGDIDHVIWDWNGTLLDDAPHAVDPINFLEPRGLPLMSVERYRGIFSFPMRRYYETLGFDLQADSFADFCDQVIDRFMAKVGECPLAPCQRLLVAPSGAQTTGDELRLSDGVIWGLRERSPTHIITGRNHVDAAKRRRDAPSASRVK
jgi:hypothetical protein